MPTSYFSVRTALSNFSPSQEGPSGQLEVKKGQTLLLLNKRPSHDGWCKFRIKTDRQQNNGGSGFVPKANTGEAESISSATACRDFLAQVDGDLTIAEHENLSVYCVEGEWALVKNVRAAGYVPRECIKLEEEMDRAIALLDFEATEEEELSLREGEILILLDQEDETWWRCKNANNEIGVVQSSHIEFRNKHGPEPAATEGALDGQNTLISRSMDESTVVSLLVTHGCKDLTSSINPSSFGKYPVTQGGYSDVFHGQLLDGVTVAVKVLRVPSSDSSELPPNHLKEAARELHTWGKCRHPNVLPLLGLAVFWDRIGMVSPWMGEGSLPGYLARTPGVNRYRLCGQICRGLSYLHKIGLIHGDLRGSSVLVSNEGVPFLSDFGSSRWVREAMDLDFTMTTAAPALSLRWAAPELILEGTQLTESSDVYALGMVLYEVITGGIPYSGKKDMEIITLFIANSKYQPPERLESIPEGHEDMDKFWELLLRCWSAKPASRPSADEVAENIDIIETLAGISRKMATQEVVSRLISHGCKDLSNKLDLASFSDYPILQGGLGDIYRGKLVDDTTIAVKVLRVSMDDMLSVGSKHIKHSARELYTWNKCRHPNIMPLLGLVVFRDRIGMVTPWMKNGNLPRFLKVVPGVNRHDMCAQICEGLSYLHQQDVVHCDLKGANVLISDDETPLLTDFGTSLVSERTLRFTATTSNASFTLRWSPAEILEGTSLHTKASDIYALGMTIYETMTGKVPYEGKHDFTVMTQVASKKFPERPECMPIGDQKSDKLWELLNRCWSYEPGARPSADEVTNAMRAIL